MSFPGYYQKSGRKERLIEKLTYPSLAPLKEDLRYQALLERANAILE
jgi:hypothetical protein